MKLKDQTFAIIAEKQGSISHKWFKENAKCNSSWMFIGEHYIYNKGIKGRILTEKPKDIPIYTESEFEALLKAEQENEAKKFPAKGDGNITLEGFSPLSGKPKELTEMPTWSKTVGFEEPKQITISYNLAHEYIAERLNVDKGVIKIEMP